jgi:hypothetical protein
MVFGHKAKPQVDLIDFDEEKDLLSGYLQTKLNAKINKVANKLFIDSITLTSEELQRLVNKYIYHHNLNTKYYVSLEGNMAKIHRFKAENKKSEKKSKNPRSPTMAHGW